MTNTGQSFSGATSPLVTAPNDAFPSLEPFEPETFPDNSSNRTVTEAEMPSSWQELRGNEDIQFEPIEITPPPPPEPPEPREPGWFDEALRSFFGWLGEIFAPIGQLLAASWPWLQWVLLAAVVAFVAYLIFRTFGPMALERRENRNAESIPEWAPSEEESVALLDDADQLAAEGRFDEATHLLLQRSVSHISAARPDWVEPSSTARELAALPALSQRARGAFATISERVERSLFALRSLDRADWETARAAYADFAQVRIDTGASGGPNISDGRASA